MAFGFGMGGYGGISLGDGPHPSRFSRRNKHRPSSNAESNIYPHAYPPKPVSEYVKEAAERAWLLPQYSWQNPGSPVSVHQLLYADPWQPDLAQPPLGYKKGDFPIAEKAASQVLSLPMYPELRADQITEIVQCLGNIMSSKFRLGWTAVSTVPTIHV